VRRIRDGDGSMPRGAKGLGCSDCNITEDYFDGNAH
jgi:hypothetical protein